MKLSNKQKSDLEVTMYFIPKAMENIPVIDSDIQMYFEWSDNGKHKDKIDTYKMDGFNSLVQGKQWRGIHMGMYEDGVLDGTMPYYDVLQSDGNITPRPVVDFMKKEMFKGIDAEIIENCYQSLLSSK